MDTNLIKQIMHLNSNNHREYFIATIIDEHLDVLYYNIGEELSRFKYREERVNFLLENKIDYLDNLYDVYQEIDYGIVDEKMIETVIETYNDINIKNIVQETVSEFNELLRGEAEYSIDESVIVYFSDQLNFKKDEVELEKELKEQLEKLFYNLYDEKIGYKDVIAEYVIENDSIEIIIYKDFVPYALTEEGYKCIYNSDFNNMEDCLLFIENQKDVDVPLDELTYSFVYSKIYGENDVDKITERVLQISNYYNDDLDIEVVKGVVTEFKDINYSRDFFDNLDNDLKEGLIGMIDEQIDEFKEYFIYTYLNSNEFQKEADKLKNEKQENKLKFKI